jgi:Caspase domain
MCIIINQKLYKKGLDLKSRLGTDLDCSRFNETFTMLGYQVAILNNVTFSTMAQKLKEKRGDIAEDCSSLVVCILAHGQKGVMHVLNIIM